MCLLLLGTILYYGWVNLIWFLIDVLNSSSLLIFVTAMIINNNKRIIANIVIPIKH